MLLQNNVQGKCYSVICFISLSFILKFSGEYFLFKYEFERSSIGFLSYKHTIMYNVCIYDKHCHESVYMPNPNVVYSK